MIIELENISGSTQYNVDIINAYQGEYIQSVNYIKLMSGKTVTTDRGASADKWISSFVIQGLKSDIFALASEFRKHKKQITITTESDELIFGAGIDYSNPFICNYIAGDIRYPQNNFKIAEIPINVQGIQSGPFYPSYRSDIVAEIPDLNYQTPVKRKINRSENPFTSINFTTYGMNNRVYSSGEPVYSYEFDLTFLQTEEETAKFEKYYSIQRSTPFIWPNLNCLDLWEGQDIENVMIKGFKSTHLSLDNWKIELKLITNV